MTGLLFAVAAVLLLLTDRYLNPAESASACGHQLEAPSFDVARWKAPSLDVARWKACFVFAAIKWLTHNHLIHQVSDNAEALNCVLSVRHAVAHLHLAVTIHQSRITALHCTG
jgi:hypothetical protein